MLRHDHRGSNGGRGRGIGALVVVGSLRERNQHSRGSANGQLAEAAGTSREMARSACCSSAGISSLRALLIGRVLQLALIRIDATGEVNDAQPLASNGRRRTHHAVQPTAPWLPPITSSKGPSPAGTHAGQAAGLRKLSRTGVPVTSGRQPLR